MLQLSSIYGDYGNHTCRTNSGAFGDGYVYEYGNGEEEEYQV